jgi:hypothetical protein
MMRVRIPAGKEPKQRHGHTLHHAGIRGEIGAVDGALIPPRADPASASRSEDGRHMTPRPIPKVFIVGVGFAGLAAAKASADAPVGLLGRS